MTPADPSQTLLQQAPPADSSQNGSTVAASPPMAADGTSHQTTPTPPSHATTGPDGLGLDTPPSLESMSDADLEALVNQVVNTPESQLISAPPQAPPPQAPPVATPAAPTQQQQQQAAELPKPHDPNLRYRPQDLVEKDAIIGAKTTGTNLFSSLLQAAQARGQQLQVPPDLLSALTLPVQPQTAAPQQQPTAPEAQPQAPAQPSAPADPLADLPPDLRAAMDQRRELNAQYQTARREYDEDTETRLFNELAEVNDRITALQLQHSTARAQSVLQQQQIQAEERARQEAAAQAETVAYQAGEIQALRTFPELTVENSPLRLAYEYTVLNTPQTDPVMSLPAAERAPVLALRAAQLLANQQGTTFSYQPPPPPSAPSPVSSPQPRQPVSVPSLIGSGHAASSQPPAVDDYEAFKQEYEKGLVRERANRIRAGV